MQKKSLVWRGFAVALATCCSVAIVNCGDDDLTDPTTTDAGTDATAGDSGSDATTTDASTDGSAVDSGTSSTVRFVLANDMTGQDSPLVICAVGSGAGGDSVAAGPPQPAAGIAVGRVGDFSLPSSFFAAATSVRFVVYYTTTLKAFGLEAKSCAEIVAQSALRSVGDGGVSDAGTKALLDTIDFETSDPRPGTDFAAGSKFLLLSSGCTKQTSQENVDNGLCGDTFEKTASSAAVWSYRLDNQTTVPAGKSLVQFVHASWSLTDFAAVKLGFRPIIRYSNADAGADAGTNDFAYGPANGIARGANGGSAQPTPGEFAPDLSKALGIGAITDPTTGRSRIEAWDSVFEGTSDTTAMLKSGGRYTTLAIGAPYADPRNADGTKNFRFAHYTILSND